MGLRKSPLRSELGRAVLMEHYANRDGRMDQDSSQQRVIDALKAAGLGEFRWTQIRQVAKSMSIFRRPPDPDRIPAPPRQTRHKTEHAHRAGYRTRKCIGGCGRVKSIEIGRFTCDECYGRNSSYGGWLAE